MITYRKYPNALSSCKYDVRLDGKLVGHIESCTEGYRYAVKGAKQASDYGEPFATIREVKDSLED